jgi:secreted PhoX family phosphatase
MDQLSRREFLKFLGRSSVAVGLAPSVLTGCSALVKKRFDTQFASIRPSVSDDLVLAEGFQYQVLLKSGDAISADSSQKFGSDCDFNVYIPRDSQNPFDGYLWTNHENINPLLTLEADIKNGEKKTKEQVEREMDWVGGSLVRLFYENSRWQMDPSHPFNLRVTAKTPMRLVAPRAIEGTSTAIGTLGNCAGGLTPWGTVLSCEENFHIYYGDYTSSTDRKKIFAKPDDDMGWHQHFDRSPLHYGWVVEFNPKTGESKKLTSLGRFAHEGATCVQAADGRTVVYMGDDAVDQCIYKFISDKPGSLENGTLYVASLEKKSWIPLSLSLDRKLQEKFKDQTELLCFAREASQIVGGTPLDRPEEIEQDPVTKDLFISLTNNVPKGRPHGSILRISEKAADPLALEFNFQTWLAGSPEVGISSPDNLAFDKSGNLWICTDRSGKLKNKDFYKGLGNNGLFFVPTRGPFAGVAIQVASAPVDAEFTGPCFLPGGEALVLSVQHPGEYSDSLAELTSHWPNKKPNLPQSSVVLITGSQLKKLVNYTGG